jgi:hypothetical protein
MIPNALTNAMVIGVAFGLGRALLKSVWGGSPLAGATLAIFALGETGSDFGVLMVLFTAAFVVPMMSTLVYFGLLAETVAFFVNQVMNNAPMTMDLSLPHISGALWPVLIILGLTAFGFYSSRSGQPLLGRLLQSD